MVVTALKVSFIRENLEQRKIDTKGNVQQQQKWTELNNCEVRMINLHVLINSFIVIILKWLNTCAI